MTESSMDTCEADPFPELPVRTEERESFLWRMGSDGLEEDESLG